MHGLPATITFRNDDEIAQALDFLDATEGNRTRIIKEAILHYAAAQRRGDVQEEVLQRIRQDLARADKLLAHYLGVTAA